MITIGIPFLNAEPYLADAIRSVLVQTFQDWELILVDDGSTDNSLQIAKQFADIDKRIRVISDGKNKRLPARLNQIICEAKGDYIARMDADDLISPKRIQQQYDFLQANPNLDLVSTGLLSLKDDLTLVGYRGTGANKTISMLDAFLGTTGIIHASVVAKKSWYVRNQYNENNRLAEDYELWQKAYLNEDLKVGFIDLPLYYYREESSITLPKLLKAYNTQIKVIKNIPEEYLIDKEKNKHVKKFEIKKLLVKFLFYTKQEKVLHSRRVTKENYEKYQQQLTKDIKLIQNFKIN